MINLIHGDCLEKMKEIPDGSVDLVLTDPPYGKTDCKWDTVIPFEPMWVELKRIIKPNGAICLFGSEPFSSHLRLSNLKQFKYDWVWNKVQISNPLLAKKRPLSCHEVISVFNAKNYYPQKEGDKERRWKHCKPSENFNRNLIGNGTTKGLYPKSIVTLSNHDRKNKIHPTQKPVPLLEYLIKTYTLENETVLDFTMGSGSTGVACKNLNRNFIGIELDENYFNIAKKRIEETP